MTEQEFIRQCFNHTAGVIALGTVAARPMLAGKLSDADAIGVALGGLNQTTLELLRYLYRTLHPTEAANESPQPGAQGGQGQGKGPAAAGSTRPTAAATKPAAATGNNSAGQRS